MEKCLVCEKPITPNEGSFSCDNEICKRGLEGRIRELLEIEKANGQIEALEEALEDKNELLIEARELVEAKGNGDFLLKLKELVKLKKALKEIFSVIQSS